ncbi:hypothetical protein GCM10012280_01390 [Wenjunlia tyrosinilytica]|uniref:Histidine kinase/HSP90-like ATPase domain-containing protein n=1 Tax=Wenjunlia tyrosinilytica TaxID=1544741 RepID=A0A917ZBA2_9ACTN|nr:hypothetical protein GCM10012280_01390 [Wenjunlia tyrosinilytica]
MTWPLLPGSPSLGRRTRSPRPASGLLRVWEVQLDGELETDVELVASELLTNALVHGHGPFLVGVYLGCGRLLLEVHDGDSTFPRERDAGRDAESGRGLPLIGALSEAHRWEPVGRGKRCWAEIKVPEAAEDEHARNPWVAPTQCPCLPPVLSTRQESRDITSDRQHSYR